MVFARESVDGAWKWGEHVLPSGVSRIYIRGVLRAQNDTIGCSTV